MDTLKRSWKQRVCLKNAAKTCKLYALTHFQCILEGNIGTMYTDSKSTSGTVHTFGTIWVKTGMIHGKGKELVMNSLQESRKIALTHVTATELPNVLSE